MEAQDTIKFVILFQSGEGGRGAFDVVKNLQVQCVGFTCFGAKKNTAISFLGTVIGLAQHGVAADGFRLSHEGILGIGKHRFVMHDLEPDSIVGSWGRSG